MARANDVRRVRLMRRHDLGSDRAVGVCRSPGRNCVGLCMCDMDDCIQAGYRVVLRTDAQTTKQSHSDHCAVPKIKMYPRWITCKRAKSAARPQQQNLPLQLLNLGGKGYAQLRVARYRVEETNLEKPVRPPMRKRWHAWTAGQNQSCAHLRQCGCVV